MKAKKPDDVGAIQAQVEASLQAHSAENRRGAKTMNFHHENTLRSRLASTTANDYYASSDDEPSSLNVPSGSGGGAASGATASSHNPKDLPDELQLKWMNEMIAQAQGDGSRSGEVSLVIQYFGTVLHDPCTPFQALFAPKSVHN